MATNSLPLGNNIFYKLMYERYMEETSEMDRENGNVTLSSFIEENKELVIGEYNDSSEQYLI